MYVYYSLDREGFIERLCENKDKPQLKCNGKCMLAKMLAAQTDDEKMPMPMIGWEQLLVFLVEPPTFTPLCANEKTQAYFHYTNHYSYSFIHISHKPPIV
ncbi:MAG: hypothetical protein R2819_04375 [Allomuricauda sp.]